MTCMSRIKHRRSRFLSGLRERYENFHHVEISDEALISAVELSSRYVTDRFMPDKAIDLIDEAASMANVTLWKQSVAKETLENEAVSLPGAVIREDEIARVIAQWTGVPVERIGSDDQQDILTLEERLSRRVIGQDEAISAITKALRRARAGLSDPNAPARRVHAARPIRRRQNRTVQGAERSALRQRGRADSR